MTRTWLTLASVDNAIQMNTVCFATHSRASQTDLVCCVHTGTYDLGWSVHHTPMTIIQNEEGKKAGDLEGCKSPESSNGRDWMGVVRKGFMEEGFSIPSQVKRTTWEHHEEDHGTQRGIGGQKQGKLSCV